MKSGEENSGVKDGENVLIMRFREEQTSVKAETCCNKKMNVQVKDILKNLTSTFTV
jgi:hypothetical protein